MFTYIQTGVCECVLQFKTNNGIRAIVLAHAKIYAKSEANGREKGKKRDSDIELSNAR